MRRGGGGYNQYNWSYNTPPLPPTPSPPPPPPDLAGCRLLVVGLAWPGRLEARTRTAGEAERAARSATPVHSLSVTIWKQASVPDIVVPVRNADPGQSGPERARLSRRWRPAGSPSHSSWALAHPSLLISETQKKTELS
ncbi:hypothetical protein PoB_004718100 [Plakobranchus ocellatus]|uniref:Uncharacterized protein n=1 Tax=Plakobranchus ocellatus TaxID=259542 RepID=A0AAV4BJU4_9GAST|nr:hypothetical protein PoB_004718100 [Plakobranchus ocellatus]